MSWTDSEIESLITFYSSVLVSGARNFATGVKNRRQKPTPVFWCWFLEHVSLALLLTLSLGCIAVLHTYMQPIVTGIAWSVCQSVIVISPAETAEPIKMPFGLWTRVNSKNHVLAGGPGPPCKLAIVRGTASARCKVWGHFAASCSKMAEPIEMWIWLWTWVGCTLAPPGIYE